MGASSQNFLEEAQGVRVHEEEPLRGSLVYASGARKSEKGGPSLREGGVNFNGTEDQAAIDPEHSSDKPDQEYPTQQRGIRGGCQ